jgi:hypothetical protein
MSNIIVKTLHDNTSINVTYYLDNYSLTQIELIDILDNIIREEKMISFSGRNEYKMDISDIYSGRLSYGFKMTLFGG